MTKSKNMAKNVLMVLFVVFLMASCTNNGTVTVTSPDENVEVVFSLNEKNPEYSVTYKGKDVVLNSAMGFVLKDQNPLTSNFEITGTTTNTYDNTWEQVWGEKQFIRNHYNELQIDLQEVDGDQRKMSVYFRAFDNGVAFRYEIPEQESMENFVIMDEVTEFAMAGDHTAWWIKAYQPDRYEYLFTESAISEMDTVHTPLTMKTTNGLYVSLHEANLIDYASYTVVSKSDNKLVTGLVPWSDGTKVKTGAPLKTPWRTIQIAEKPGDLITNYMVLNLNEPNKLADLSYIKPSKYMGIWWGMHIGKYTFWESPDLGATTENAKMYIDFASEHGVPLLLIEGWNKGWTPQWYMNRMHQFSFTESVDAFDLEEVVEYGKERGVNLIGYHETGSNLISYLDQVDDGFALYRDLGIHDIKIGQVGSKLNMKEWHHGQFGVNYYRTILKKAADNKLAVNFHEPIKDTGERRTYPNMMTREGGRGMEYDAWSDGNPPNHLATIPFTRLLAGPMDFTPGIFDIMIKYREGRRVHTTLAKQLAAYVVVLSPTQMMAGLPENYEGHPALKFLLDVPVDWYDTKVLNAEIGGYVTMVRKDKASDDWYLGSVTNEKARDFIVDLSFLDEGKQYKAEIYADGEDCDLETNPTAIDISEKVVDANTQLNIKLAAGGGQAIRFTPVQ
ncbi:MAG: glycoside hydrolase family 97 protein [Prolixibacteraceae bacterium]|nr:glycoside hydrolase family 97 protein [Prolixibacteraceae bacterium]